MSDREAMRLALRALLQSGEQLTLEAITALRARLAAPEPEKRHPGYVIGNHWLETAYSRICAGEAEANVLRDYGLMREEAFLTGVAHLKAEIERLREALKLALNSHGRMLMSDPPQDPWKVNRVDEIIRELLQEDKT